MDADCFEQALRQAGDLAGVFEYDGETGYFYLYDNRKKHQKIIDAIHIVTGLFNMKAGEIEIRWDNGEVRVGLFLRGIQWAVFNVESNSKFGGGFSPKGSPQIPSTEGF
jgi:hypothetical protein